MTKKQEQKVTSGSSLRAYEDLTFLKSDAARCARLQLEYLKPDAIFDLNSIESTIVIFGSARTLPPDVAAERLAEAQANYKASPEDAMLAAAVAKAERDVQESHYYQVAREFGNLVTKECQSRNLNPEHQFVVLTGGGNGIMEAGNRGAADAGGISASLNITLPFEQRANDYITPELNFTLHYFSIRKMHFLKRAKGLACFPGGFGTMDELFEAMTLIQTKKIPRIPVMLFGRDFWEQLINWDVFVKRRYISPGDLDLFTFCETAQEGWNVLQTFYKNNVDEKLSEDSTYLQPF